MDPLELNYDSLDAVPEAFRPLYSEKDGKFALTAVNGLKTVQDVANVQEALRKERNDKAALEAALRPWKDLKHSEVMAQLDRVRELEAAAAGKIDEKKLEEIVTARIGQKTGPLERQLNEYKTNFETAAQERDALKQQIARRDLSDAVRTVATEMKVVSTAIADVEMIASVYLERDETTGNFIVKNGVPGITPGLDVKGFMKEMQKQRPHWWPASQGGGANGGGAGGDSSDNPWSAKNWNLTKQGQVIKTQGLAAAEQMAKSVGSYVGASQPTKAK